MPDRSEWNRWPAALWTLGLLAMVALLVLVMLALTLGAPPAAGTDGVENITVYRSTADGFDDARAVKTAITNGTVRRSDRIVRGETLVVAIDSNRLAEQMAAGNGSSTDRFLDAIKGAATFRFVQTNPTTQVPPLVASVGRVNVTAYRTNLTTYVLVDTGALRFHHPDSSVPERIHGGERFVIRFGYNISDPSSRPDRARPTIGVFPHAAAFDTNGHWYEPLPPEWIRLPVEVNIVPERSVIVRLRTANRTRATPVRPATIPGFADVWLDLREVPPGTSYTLELVHDGTVVDRNTGQVRQPSATLRNLSITTARGQTTVNVTAALSHGGAVQVLDENCTVVGWAWVEPSEATRVSIGLWTDRGRQITAAPRTYPVALRAVRARGTSRTAYTGSAAAVSHRMNSSCPGAGLPRSPPSTPTPMKSTPDPSITTKSPSTTRPTTIQTPTMTRPSTTAPIDEGQSTLSTTPPGPGTETPGQSGFGLSAATIAVILLAGLRAHR